MTRINIFSQFLYEKNMIIPIINANIEEKYRGRKIKKVKKNEEKMNPSP